MKILFVVLGLVVSGSAFADFTCANGTVIARESGNEVALSGPVDNLPMTIGLSDFRAATQVDLGFNGGGYREYLVRLPSGEWEVQIDYDGKSTGHFACKPL